MVRAAIRILVVLAAVATAAAADRAAQLDALFERLAAAKTEAEGRAIEGQIWQLWTVGPDDAATDRMARVLERRRAYDFAEALALSEALTEDYPGWAETWNQKATLLFLTERPDASLDAIERVLALEPRHFGALAGKAIILMRQGRARLAQQALRRAVALHPWLRERGLLVPDPGQDL